MDRENLIEDDSQHYLPLLRDFARRRRRLVTMMAIAALLVSAAGAGFLLFRAPRETQARCHFRLEFNGAERGVYPSGLPFVPQEITARAALRHVYENARMADSGITFRQFLNGIYIIESDPTLDRMRIEMANRLAGARTQIERDGISELFALRKKNQITREYDLILSLPTSSALPADRMKRVLTSLLETWASTTGREKARIDIPGTTAQDLDGDTIPAGQPLLALEDLRLKTIAAMLRASALAGTEGAALARDPRSGLTAKMVESDLSDIVRWNIDPLVANLLRRGVFNDYTVDALASQVRYDSERKMFSDERSSIIQQGFATYSLGTSQTTGRETAAVPPRQAGEETASRPSVVAQVDVSLLDRLVDLTGQGADQSFRQQLTNQFLNERTLSVPTEIEIRHFRTLVDEVSAARGPRAAPSSEDEAAVRAVTARVRAKVEALDAIAARVTEARVFSGTLYSSEPAYVRSQSYVPWRMIALAALLPFVILPLVLIAVFFIDHYRMAWAAEPGNAPVETQLRHE